MVELFANSGDPDQMPHSAASDVGMHCLPVTLLGLSRLQWVNEQSFNDTLTNDIVSFKQLGPDQNRM